MIDLIEKGYIPLDKSWMIRMGFLDLINGHNDIIRILQEYENLSDDLKALYSASIDWMSNKQDIRVGESGTLFRFLQFAAWKYGMKKNFIKSGTLRKRKITDDSNLVNLPLEQLLELDGGTSQWASAAVLLGNTEIAEDAPIKLALTYNALDHYNQARHEGKCWKISYDKTIEAQAQAFLQYLRDGEMDFRPKQAEDYCFARAFGKISREMGEMLWPQLKGHESNRLKTMENHFLMNLTGIIFSRDHRVVQAFMMKGKTEGKKYWPLFRNCVNKSWPQFYKFLDDSVQLAFADEKKIKSAF